MPLERRRRIAIERRADILGDHLEADILGMEHAVAIGKMMHGTGGLLNHRIKDEGLVFGRRFAAGGFSGGPRTPQAETASSSAKMRAIRKGVMASLVTEPLASVQELQPALASRFTLAGAVPPKLLRAATEASTVSTLNTPAVILGCTACISASVSSDKIAALRLGQRHQPPGDVMRLAERQAQFAHQPVGEVGRGR